MHYLKTILCKDTVLHDIVRVGRDVIQRVVIRFDDVVVGGLSYYEVEISNPNHETIENIRLRFDFGDACNVLAHTKKTIPPQTGDFDIIDDKKATHDISFLIPYLNQSKHHKHKVMLGFYCDGSLDKIQITGSSIGWSIKHKKLRFSKPVDEFFVRSIVEGGTQQIFFYIFVYMFIVYPTYYKLAGSPTDLRQFLLNINTIVCTIMYFLSIFTADFFMRKWAKSSLIWARIEDQKEEMRRRDRITEIARIHESTIKSREEHERTMEALRKESEMSRKKFQEQQESSRMLDQAYIESLKLFTLKIEVPNREDEKLDNDAPEKIEDNTERTK